MKRVSIIIPVYNVEQYVEECLLSVTNQTAIQFLECLIVDDCGNDNSMQIVEDFISSLPLDRRKTFRIINRDKNGGLSAARNTGIQEAKGEYIYFVDSDDTIREDAIEVLLNIADKNGGVDLLPALYKTHDGSKENFGELGFEIFTEDCLLIKKTLLDYDKISVTTTNRLIRRMFLVENGLWFKEGIIHEDNYWTFFAAKKVERLAVCREKLYYHRYNEKSITHGSSNSKQAQAYICLVKSFSKNIDNILPGHQKVLILNTMFVALNSHFIESELEKKEIIKEILDINTVIEKTLLLILLRFERGFLFSKLYHLLIRIYKLNE